MVRTSHLRAICGAAIAAGLVFAAGATDANAGCRGAQATAASGLFKTTAGIGARNAWRLKVMNTSGIGFALWSNSKNRKTTCEKKSTGGWRCVARARPCA
jgi:hypothetical protein